MKRPKWENENPQPPHYVAFVQVQNTCPLCNSQLTIRVENGVDDYTLREEATCPKCQVPARSKEHRLH
ncbi:MAG: hypothetical protein AB7G93_02910 [Bdellovibrionales bacterium]